MTDLDCRILSRACGLCWHIENPYIKTDNGTYLFSPYCKECGEVIYKDGWYYGGLIDNFHHDFTTADDWELVRVKVVVEYLKHYICYLEVNGGNALWYRLTQTSEENCQSVADFIKARPDLFPWAVEMEEKK